MYAYKSIFVGINLLTATEQMDMFRALFDPPTLGIFNVKLNAASNAAAALNPANGREIPSKILQPLLPR
jgi:hypothetical protein